VAESGERRMVFDIRGRRKHVVRVVYAILALLMGASLFLVVGPFNLGSLVGNSGTANTKFEQERAERIEQKLVRDPNNEALLLGLTRARISAGTLELETNPETGATTVTPEARANYTRGIEAWSRYLKQADSPSISGATVAVTGYIRLAESSGGLEEAEENIDGVVKAQRILADARPSLGTLSNLALYEYYAGNFGAGDKASRQALAKVPKVEAKETKKKLAEYRAVGEQFEKQKKEVAKQEKKAGKERLENPFGGLGTSPGALGG
jgi:hypothetical protein